MTGSRFFLTMCTTKDTETHIEFLYSERSLEAQSSTVISCNKDVNLKFKI